jgi:hypothetical protein
MPRGHRWAVVVATVVCASLAGCAPVPLPPAVAATPDTLAAIARAPRVLAVHYRDLEVDGDHVYVGAPTARIKARFLDRVQTRLPLPALRDVTAPRFPYREPPAIEASAARLQRTYRTGYVFDVYSLARHLDPAFRTFGDVTVHARLIRLDDLTVLWTRHCRFPADPLRRPGRPPRLTSVEELYPPAALQRADDCADQLAEHLLSGAR